MNIPSHLKPYVGALEDILAPMVSEARLAKMKTILQQRSRHVVTVFENTHHAHNISAAIRNVDTFGFFDLHFVYSNTNMRFRAADSIDRGASQWLFLKRFTSIPECAQQLKNQGYRIALVSLPHFSRTSTSYASNLPSFASTEFLTEPFEQALSGAKIALVFGSELLGVDPAWISFAHMYCHVPMYGFTESLNVSVCAGILLHALRTRIQAHKHFGLDAQEMAVILDYWLSRDVLGARTFVAERHLNLLPWFDFVCQGKNIAQ